VSEADPPADLKLRTKAFALRILRLVAAMPTTVAGQAIARQIVRSGTSVGANYRAARRARTDAEFLAKLGVVEEEADETAFWLELIVEDKMLPNHLVEPLLDEANQIVAMIVQSKQTTRKRMKNPKT